MRKDEEKETEGQRTHAINQTDTCWGQKESDTQSPGRQTQNSIPLSPWQLTCAHSSNQARSTTTFSLAFFETRRSSSRRSTTAAVPVRPPPLEGHLETDMPDHL